MFKHGMYSTQDFHYFRFVEFDKCVRDFQIPCRWSSESGFGYGEPLFNFYTQLPYFLGEIFHLIGIPILDSLKILFAFSLIGSGITMYLLAKKIWKNSLGALISAVLYVYAPYRAVDVWVRGALPEALAFIIFPLIILKFEDFLEREKKKDLLLLGGLLAILILTHNLSLLLFTPFLVIWIIYKIILTKKFKLVWLLIASLTIPISISAFYILPIFFESKFITLQATIREYFDFRGHFVDFYQLLISRFWGYGASVFGPEDEMSLSVGHFQWILPIMLIAIVSIKKKLRKYNNLIILIIIGWLTIFLTHNQSTFIWELVKPMAYIQFPWRFIGISVFAFALSGGCFVNLIKKHQIFIVSFMVFLIIIINFSFFREDIWYKVTDNELTSGEKWKVQTAASIKDYWPSYGPDVPTSYSPTDPKEGKLIEKTSNKIIYSVTKKKLSETVFPITYFPGWQAFSEGRVLDIYPSGRYGLIATKSLLKGEQIVIFRFSNTRIRTIGNVISFVSLIIYFLLLRRIEKYEN